MVQMTRLEGEDGFEAFGERSYEYSRSELQAPLELELSSREFLALSKPPAAAKPARNSAQSRSDLRSHDSRFSIQTLVERAQPQSSPAPSVWLQAIRRWVTAPSPTAVGLIAAFALAGVAAYVFARFDEPPLDVPVAQVETSSFVPEAPPVQVAQALPVRVSNPFDASEVFEFPPGTSAAAAQDAVAERLMRRAMGRLDKPTREAGTRRSGSAARAGQRVRL